MKRLLIFSGHLFVFSTLFLLLSRTVYSAEVATTQGVAISYSLPTDGPLPKTWRVTLAIVDPDDPANILSTFVAGEPVTVTKENQGKFESVWNGLDDNFMPLPPGDYGLKGIAMPAKPWHIDGQWHSLTPQYLTAAVAFQPPQDQDNKPLPFSGDPVHSPLRDIDVSDDGILVFGYQYLENGLNSPMVDIKKPVGYEQFLRAFSSGGAGSCEWTTTDGLHSWAVSNDGGVPFIYRTDGVRWGSSDAKHRRNVHLEQPGKKIGSIASLRRNDRTEIYVTLSLEGGGSEVAVLNGDNGDTLPQSWKFSEKIIAIDNGKDDGLYVLLRASEQEFRVKRLDTDCVVLSWNSPTPPSDLTVDRNGSVYVTYPQINAVAAFDKNGRERKIIMGDGKGDLSRTGTYDPSWLLYPERLTNWTDMEGKTRLLVLESHGHNRVAEWSTDGELLREWLTLQTWANDGYDADPKDPTKIYIIGQGQYLVRFHVDYDKATWTVDAVWPNVQVAPFQDAQKVKIVYANGQRYAAFEKKFVLYRFDENRCVPSAAIFREQTGNRLSLKLWRDANGNGLVEENEKTPIDNPAKTGHIIRYHGDRVLDDLSLICIEQDGIDVWRLPVTGFDHHGNPIYAEKFECLLTDPVFAAMQNGVVDALHGGNECAANYNSDWASLDGNSEIGYWIQARGGPSFTANFGGQYKLTRYVPDGKGGFRAVWRVGRAALQGLAKPGEIYGGMYVWQKAGLVGVVDQSRMGIVVYNEDGLYVDTLFPDEKSVTKEQAGIYRQGGEFFAGRLTEWDGQVYALLGKYTPEIYKIEGWNRDFANTIKTIQFPKQMVTLSVSQTSSPPEIAIQLRGGAGSAKFARFQPATGGQPALDGSLDDWLACEPVVFQSAKDQIVYVRGMYDEKNIYLHWQVRLGDRKISPQSGKNPERIFTHDREADTLSFYLQTDPEAAKSNNHAGRPGDVRFVFTLTQEPGQEIIPMVLGMYSSAPPLENLHPLTYRSPVGTATFAHVGTDLRISMGHQIDADQKGFVLAAAIPLEILPKELSLKDGARTLGNFDATFGGHNRFWWSNADGSASKETYDEPSEARIYPGSWAMFQFIPLTDTILIRSWQVAGPWDNNENRDFRDGNEVMKKAIVDYYEQYVTPPDVSSYPFWGDFTRQQSRPWQLRSVEGTDPQLKLAQAGRLYHQMVWAHSPDDIEVRLRFYARPMTQLRVGVTSELMKESRQLVFNNVKDEERAEMVTLQKGWNRILLRNYTFGYGLEVGMTIHASPEILWKLRISAAPRSK